MEGKIWKCHDLLMTWKILQMNGTEFQNISCLASFTILVPCFERSFENHSFFLHRIHKHLYNELSWKFHKKSESPNTNLLFCEDYTPHSPVLHCETYLSERPNTLVNIFILFCFFPLGLRYANEFASAFPFWRATH